jgi:hypothetical protein
LLAAVPLPELEPTFVKPSSGPINALSLALVAVVNMAVYPVAFLLVEFRGIYPGQFV